MSHYINLPLVNYYEYEKIDVLFITTKKGILKIMISILWDDFYAATFW
jgi:hypothetical protein